MKVNEILKKSEVLDMFGIGNTTAWNWTNKGWLKPISIGSKIYYKTSDINELIESGYSGEKGNGEGGTSND